ncbi:hypothetical protein [Haladaptatus sp. NG-WS-4]
MRVPQPRSKRAEAWAFVYRGLFDVPDDTESGDESTMTDER